MVIAAGVLGIGAAVSADAIAESWWLFRLRSSDDAVRTRAADRLVEAGSLRAVPALVQAIAADEREWARTRTTERIFCSRGEPMDSFGIEETVLEATPLLHALYRLGPTARPVVEQAIEALGEERGRLKGSLSAVVEAWALRDVNVQRLEYGVENPRVS